MILGTAAYMSPEQARGKSVDKRADIWAFGAVLFEALSGVTPFEGETVTDLLAAIIHKEPRWSALPADLPTSMRRLLRYCLTKDAAKRLRDIGDARLALDEPDMKSTPKRSERSWTTVVSAMLLTAAATAVVTWSLRPETPPHRPSSFFASCGSGVGVSRRSGAIGCGDLQRRSSHRVRCSGPRLRRRALVYARAEQFRREAARGD